MILLTTPAVVTGLLFLALFVTIWFVKNSQRNRPSSGTFVGRFRTRDISFLAQSAVGFIGRITRSVPLPKTVAMVNDGTNPVASFGLAVLATATNTARGLIAGDTAITAIFGIAISPFPIQAASASNYGAQSLTALTPVPANTLIDVLKTGFAMVYCNSAQAPTANNTSPVYVWVAASSGTHIQGGFETAASAGNTAGPIPNAYFAGPGDSTGAIELAFNL